jgi:phage baseplate assembly protein gpV
MSQLYGGIYEGLVTSVDDPERRHRVGVEVILPGGNGVAPTLMGEWAAVCNISGKQCGDFFPYNRGDTVYVMFLGGDPMAPVVVGGINNESSGIPDEPMENKANYRKGLNRWSRVDRNGNVIEMSWNPDEDWVKVKSGGSEIAVSATGGGTISIASLRGSVTVAGQNVNVQAGTASVSAQRVDVTGLASDGEGLDSGAVEIASNGTIDIHSETGTAAMAKVNIGGGAQKLDGTPVPGSTPYQDDETNIRGEVVNIGGGNAGASPKQIGSEGSMDREGAVILKPTLEVNIRSSGKVTINSGTSTVVASDTKVTVKSSVAVDLDAPQVNVKTLSMKVTT